MDDYTRTVVNDASEEPSTNWQQRRTQQQRSKAKWQSKNQRKSAGFKWLRRGFASAEPA
jgi:hypothetical protein